MVHQVWLPYHWGSSGLVDRRLGERPVRRRRSTRTCSSRRARSPPATSGPGRRPRGPRAAGATSRDYRRAPGSRSRRAPARHRPGRRTRARRGGADAGTAAGARRTDVETPEARSAVTDATACTARWPTRPATPATPSTRRASGSSPTPRSASAARPARWPARSGTPCPTTGFDLLGMSFDNTGALGANSWRHVAFIEQPRTTGRQDPGLAGLPTGAPARAVGGGRRAAAARRGARGGELGTSPLPAAQEAAVRVSPVEDLGMPAFSSRATGTAPRAARSSAG